MKVNLQKMNKCSKSYSREHLWIDHCDCEYCPYKRGICAYCDGRRVIIHSTLDSLTHREAMPTQREAPLTSSKKGEDK